MKFPDPLKFRHCICSVTACCPCATPAHINPATNNEAAAFMAVFPPTPECVTAPQAAILRTYHSETALPAPFHALFHRSRTSRAVSLCRQHSSANSEPHGSGFGSDSTAPASPGATTKYPSRVRTVTFGRATVTLISWNPAVLSGVAHSPKYIARAIHCRSDPAPCAPHDRATPDNALLQSPPQ